jgi:type II secretory pathway pseudopilin PulG
MAPRNSGFTLVEVVVASFLLAFAFAGVLVAMSTMSRTAWTADSVNRTTHQARQVLEDLRTRSFADPALALGTNAMSNGFYVVWAATTNSTLRQVTVTQYAVVRGRTTQVDMTTFMTRALHP